MGGNALKEFGVSRVTTEELHMAIDGLRKKVFNVTKAVWAIPASIKNKETHGDLDVVVVDSYRESIRELLKDLDSKKNGPVDSVAWPFSPGKSLQVDFIYIPKEEFEYAVNYFCFNDLGNLCGRFAHKMGLKHGHDGLKYIVRDGVQTVLGEIVLTRDFARALTFLGFDYERYLQGFDTLEEIYRYVSDHPKFSPKMFDLAERNHTARVRDRKRPTYTGFLSWIEDNRMFLGDYLWPEDKSAWLPTIFKEFPEAKVQYDAMWGAYRDKEKARTKFNGVMVGQLTGLREKPLGRLIQAFKEAHPDWVEYVNSLDQDEVDREVFRLYDSIFGDKNVSD